MNRTVYFFFSCVLSYLMVNNCSLATEKKGDLSPSSSKSASRSMDYTPSSSKMRSPSKRSQPKQPTSSLKDYLSNAENTQIDIATDAAHAQRAYELTLEDEGMLPPENTGVYTE